MIRFADGTLVKTPLFASSGGTRTSKRNVIWITGGAFVESDWTVKTCTILEVTPIIGVDTKRPADPKPWTGSSLEG